MTRNSANNPFLKELLEHVDSLYQLNHTGQDVSDIIDNILKSRCKYVGYELSTGELEQRKLEYLLFILTEMQVKPPTSWTEVEANNEKLKVALKRCKI